MSNSDEARSTPARFGGWVVACSCVLIFTSLTCLLFPGHWLGDLLANLRIQQLIGLSLLGLASAAMRQYRWLSFQLLLVVTHVAWLSPTGAPATAGGEGKLRLLSVNVLTQNEQYERLVSLIHQEQPDVIAIQELGFELDAHLQQAISEMYPHSLTRPQEPGNFGIGLYSRWPLEETETLVFDEPGIPTIAATITLNQATIRVITTHPVPPIRAAGFESRNEHLRQLADWIRMDRTRFSGQPQVLSGDFNLTPWSNHFRDLETRSGLRRDTRGWGVQPTWYVLPVFPLGLVLDHVLVSEEIQVANYRVGPDIGSDHRPLILDLRFPENESNRAIAQ